MWVFKVLHLNVSSSGPLFSFYKGQRLFCTFTLKLVYEFLNLLV